MFKFYRFLRIVSINVAIMGVLSVFLNSCGSTRPYIYMQGEFDTARLSQIKVTDPVVQKGDMVSIIVFSDNPEATKIFNQPLIASPTAAAAGAGGSEVQQGIAGGAPTSNGYLVDDNGNIEFQGLGLLHIEGLTRSQIKQLLDSKLKEYLKNPYYTIRFLNNRFTMLGEVNRPGLFSIPSEHINMLEALGLAGEMTFYGRRDNVLVIREQNGKREFGRMDLTKPEVMASPYFYLQQNDIVIVEQNRKKVVASDQITTRNLTIASTVISTLAILYSIFRK